MLIRPLIAGALCLVASTAFAADKTDPQAPQPLKLDAVAGAMQAVHAAAAATLENDGALSARLDDAFTQYKALLDAANKRAEQFRKERDDARAKLKATITPSVGN